MSSTITVLNWSLGSDSEYGGFLDSLDPLAELPPEKSFVETTRNKVATQAFKTLIEANQVDVICLQNAGEDLYRIKTWLGENFEVVSDGKDTAVAFTKRFESEGILSLDTSENQRYTILTLRDKQTAKIFKVASAHLFFDIKEKRLKESISSKVILSLKGILSELAESENSIIGLEETTIAGTDDNRTLLEQLNSVLKTNSFINSTQEGSPRIYSRGFSPEFVDFTFKHDPRNNPSPHMPFIERLTFIENLQTEEEETAALEQSSSSSSSSSASAAKQDKPLQRKPDSLLTRTSSNQGLPDDGLPGTQPSVSTQVQKSNPLSQSAFSLRASTAIPRLESPESEEDSSAEETPSADEEDLPDYDLVDKLFKSDEEESPPPNPEPEDSSTPAAGLEEHFDDDLVEEPTESAAAGKTEREKPLTKNPCMEKTKFAIALFVLIALPIFASLYANKVD